MNVGRDERDERDRGRGGDEPATANEAPIGLAAAIRSLRAELVDAMEEGADESLRFRLGPVELEFLVEVERAASAEGGVRFWVVSLGGKAGVTKTGTHRVTITLQAEDREGKPVQVSDNLTEEPP